MPVCKFYLQGKCKYGDRCYNEHPRGQSNRAQRWDDGGYNQSGYAGQDYGRRHQQQYYQGYDRREHYEDSRSHGRNYHEENSYRERSYQTHGKGNQRGYSHDRYHWSKDASSGNRFAQLAEENPDNNIQVMLSTIKSDIKTWAESKMWPFSCYAYNKGASCIEGLPDISPEEMRVLALLHPMEYQNITSEVEATYSKTKDELFSMSDTVKSNLVSQMNISDTNPSRDLKIALLYGPGFNFKATVPQNDPALLQPEQSASSNMFSTSQQDHSSSHETSFGTSLVTSQNSLQSPAVQQPEKPQNISIFGSAQKTKNVPRCDEVYTPYDMLTESERKKFDKNRFEIGKIPTRPPSEQYCK